MTRIFIKVVLFVTCFCGFAFAQQPPLPKLELDYFFSPTCHICHKVRENTISRIEEVYKDKLSINFRDINLIENYRLFLTFKEKYGLSQNSTVPIVYFSGKLFSGEKEIAGELIKFIDLALAKGASPRQDAALLDLKKFFLSFTPLTVIGAGLIDGINPCAFTVVVFFISFLALQGYRKKDLAVVGMFFIVAVFVTYLLLGLGLFSFFYSFKGFWLVRKVFNLSVGMLSLIFAVMAVIDFIRFKVRGKTEGMSLQLPVAVKNQIHKVIGLHYRKEKPVNSSGASGGMFKLSVTALFTGFLVSILEAVCTGQVYLPTITFVLKATSVKMKAIGYLLLYNLMFILPLFVIFLCALAGVTSEDFSRFLKKHFLTTKALMAILFFVLGIYLVWRA